MSIERPVNVAWPPTKLTGGLAPMSVPPAVIERLTSPETPWSTLP